MRVYWRGFIMALASIMLLAGAAGAAGPDKTGPVVVPTDRELSLEECVNIAVGTPIM